MDILQPTLSSKLIELVYGEIDAFLNNQVNRFFEFYECSFSRKSNHSSHQQLLSPMTTISVIGGRGNTKTWVNFRHLCTFVVLNSFPHPIFFQSPRPWKLKELNKRQQMASFVVLLGTGLFLDLWIVLHLSFRINDCFLASQPQKEKKRQKREICYIYTYIYIYMRSVWKLTELGVLWELYAK